MLQLKKCCSYNFHDEYNTVGENKAAFVSSVPFVSIAPWNKNICCGNSSSLMLFFHVLYIGLWVQPQFLLQLQRTAIVPSYL